MNNYFPRIVDQILKDELDAVGAILIEGPKWCGKTSTAEQIAKSKIYMNDTQQKDIYRLFAQTNPTALLEGDTPHLIDEWQIEADKIWDCVRYEVDHRQKFGQFILTGSATPHKMDKDTHSGTGRIKRLTMRTMSLYESKDSTGEISLKSLFENPIQNFVIKSSKKLEDIDFLICRGGWPMAIISDSEKVSLKQVYNYYDALLYQEIAQTDDVRERNPELTASILKSYARLCGSSSSNTMIREDTLNHGSINYSQGTFDNYLNDLKRLFVFEEMAAWNPNLRSKTAIRTSSIRYFTDPSVAIAALGAGPGSLMKDLRSFGFLFENLVIRDLRIYANSINGKIYHYRDKNNLECDAVIVLQDGRYALIEIKLGGNSLIEEGSSNLNKFNNIINTDIMGTPVFKMIICAISPYAYKREDGIFIVPIDLLKN